MQIHGLFNIHVFSTSSKNWKCHLLCYRCIILHLIDGGLTMKITKAIWILVEWISVQWQTNRQIVMHMSPPFIHKGGLYSLTCDNSVHRMGFHNTSIRCNRVLSWMYLHSQVYWEISDKASFYLTLTRLWCLHNYCRVMYMIILLIHDKLVFQFTFSFYLLLAKSTANVGKCCLPKARVYSINTKSVDWLTSRFLHNYNMHSIFTQSSTFVSTSKPNAENPAWIRPAVANIFEVKPVYTFSIYTVRHVFLFCFFLGGGVHANIKKWWVLTTVPDWSNRFSLVLAYQLVYVTIKCYRTAERERDKDHLK